MNETAGWIFFLISVMGLMFYDWQIIKLLEEVDALREDLQNGGGAE